MKDQTELFPPPADCQSWRTWQLLSKMATVGHVTDGQADRHSQPWSRTGGDHDGQLGLSPLSTSGSSSAPRQQISNSNFYILPDLAGYVTD